MKKNRYITPAIEISIASAQTIMAGSNISLGGYNSDSGRSTGRRVKAKRLQQLGRRIDESVGF